MYVPWLLHFFGPGPTPGDDGEMEFPGSILFIFFGLGYHDPEYGEPKWV